MMIGVLDDNLAICQLLETLFSFAGYLVSAFTNSTDFIKYIDYFACIVVDFHLSEQRSGVDVIRHVRRRRPHLPAVLISANPIPPAVLQELRDVEILRKPFPHSRLLEAVAAAQESIAQTLHEAPVRSNGQM